MYFFRHWVHQILSSVWLLAMYQYKLQAFYHGNQPLLFTSDLLWMHSNAQLMVADLSYQRGEHPEKSFPSPTGVRILQVCSWSKLPHQPKILSETLHIQGCVARSIPTVWDTKKKNTCSRQMQNMTNAILALGLRLWYHCGERNSYALQYMECRLMGTAGSSGRQCNHCIPRQDR